MVWAGDCWHHPAAARIAWQDLFAWAFVLPPPQFLFEFVILHWSRRLTAFLLCAPVLVNIARYQRNKWKLRHIPKRVYF